VTKTFKATRPIHLRVTRPAESAIRAGHPWVFADSIRDQNRPGTAGELAVVYNQSNRFLAFGLFDPDSPIRLRILQTGAPARIDRAWWKQRLDCALAKREGLFDASTNAYRLIHGENDSWPGLVLDRYASTAVLKLYTAAWFPYLPMVVDLLQETTPCQQMVLRLSRNIQTSPERRRTMQDGAFLFGSEFSRPVEFLETGLRFEADVQRGQKTGFFLDQRENRRAVEALSAGRAILNAFSFSGAFSVYAARGGAKSVTDLDISPHALQSAQRNFRLNAHLKTFRHCSHELIQADAFDWLKATSQSFDLIILDPPSFARREAERPRALKAYNSLAGLAIDRLRPKGILVAASCSAHVSTDQFFEAVRTAARNSGRSFVEIKTTGHPPDHPVGFKEGEYLKCIYLKRD